MEQLTRLSKLFSGFGRAAAVKYSPVNVFTSEEDGSSHPSFRESIRKTDLTITGDVLTRCQTAAGAREGQTGTAGSAGMEISTAPFSFTMWTSEG